MNLFSKLPERFTRAISRAWMKTRSASPEICVVSGILCGGAALVMVGIRTWKGKDILTNDIDRIKQAKKAGFITKEVLVDEEDPNNPGVNIGKTMTISTVRSLTEEEKKILLARRIDFAKDILKTYWLPAILAASSTGMIWGGRTILRRELSTATAAYAALLETYNKYRKRVASVIGEEKERQLAYGYSMEEHIDEKSGDITQTPVITKEQNLSQYGFWFNDGYFDKESGEWAWRNFTHHTNDRWQNRMTVKEIQDCYTRDLRTIGYVFLEDVALKFGLDPMEAKKFHDIGWVWKDGSENRIEFGVLDSVWQLPVNRGFMADNCSQNECLINPNVDGYIGFVRDNYRKYDRRYGYGKIRKESMNRKIAKLSYRYDKEQMERMTMSKRA